MATLDSQTKTTYATTDWDHYQTGRPAYPPSLTQLIYSYRSEHSPEAPSLRLVDIGAGSGVAATNFMADFQVIHNSDPSPWNEKQARSFLTAYAQKHNLNPKLEFSQASGEEAYHKTGENDADLVICATAAHFMDGDALMSSVSRILRPGGTFAIFSYWMPWFPDCSDEFNDLFERTFDTVVLTPLWNSADATAKSELEKVIERRMTGNGCLDSIPVPEEYFSDPVRVYINAGKGPISFSKSYSRFRRKDGDEYGKSKVVAKEMLLFYQSGKDKEAEGWSFAVDKKFLSNFFATIRPPHAKDCDESREAFKKWERMFDKEASGGMVRITWPAYLVLGTRK